MYTFDWLAKRADLSPEKTALLDAATGREFTYAEFNQRASRFAEFLRDGWGIGPGERIAIRLRSEKELVNLSTVCTNPAGQVVCEGEALVLVRDLEPCPR